MHTHDINDTALARGRVTWGWRSPDGTVSNLMSSHNQLSFSAADALASAYGGDTSLIPRYIGFIYGDSYRSDPQDITPPSDRDQTWEKLSRNLRTIHGNILISKFSHAPSVSAEQHEGISGGLILSSGNDPEQTERVYSGNAVTFHAVTRSGAAGIYGFPTTDSDYAGEFGDGSFIYHAMLLGAVSDNCPDLSSTTYIPLARVSLASHSGGYLEKPENYELALDWKVIFY